MRGSMYVNRPEQAHPQRQEPQPAAVRGWGRGLEVIANGDSVSSRELERSENSGDWCRAL